MHTLDLKRHLIGLLLAAALPGGTIAFAETTGAAIPPATQPGASGGATSASAILVAQQVPGVTPGMSLEEVVKLGYTALSEQRLTQAAKIFAAALREQPRHPTAMLGLAGTYEAESRQARGSSDPEMQKRGDALIDGAVEWFLAAGAIFLENGDYRQAGSCYQRVLSHRPLSAPAQLGLARSSAALKQDVAAIEQYKDYLKNQSAPPDTLAQANLELAQVYRRSRFYALAMDALNTALGRDRENPEIYVELARTLFDKADYAGALRHVQTAISKSQSNPEYHVLQAQILLAQEKPGDAVKAAFNAVVLARRQQQADPDDLRVLASLSNYYGAYSQILQQFLAANPGEIPARVDLAHAIREQAEINHRLALFQALSLLRTPDAQRNPRLLEAALEILIALNMPDQAGQVARQLQQVDPHNTLAERVLTQLAQLTAIPSTQSSR